MLDRKLTIFFCAIFFILAEIPSALCISPAPIVYVSGDESGDFNCNATDAALKISAALQFVAENSNYTTVYLKGPFTYIVNDTLLISSNTTLTGDSNVTIKLASNLSWPVDRSLIQERSVDSHDITVRGFTMDGNREGNKNVSSGKGYHNFITLTQCQNIKVYDMYLTNNHGNGFKGVHCDNVKFYNNRVYELGHDVFSTTYTPNIDVFNNYIYLRTNSGIRLYNSNYASLHDNVITSNSDGGVGIQIQKYGSPTMDNIEIYNNTIYRTALAGIWLFGSNSYPSSSAYVHVHHNRIYETGTKANKNVGGIMSNGFNALIKNNVIDGVYGAGIVQNTIYSPGPTGSGYSLTVRNNIISNTRTSTAGGYGYGMYNLLTGSHSFVLQNNCLYNNSGGDYEGVQDSPSDIAADPQYANRSAHDYHLKSMYGRWDGSSWINDTVNSPCIDAGYSFSDYSNEPEDNGDRINIGLYGNSIYASKSGPSNPESRPSIFTEISVTANGSDQSNPAIYNNRIVWQDARNSASDMTSDIYMYDLSTSKETQITKNGSWASSPAIYGDRIVWEDNRNKSSDIYMYDLSTSTETPISTNGSWQGHPVIYGDRIVWEDFRNGNWDIYMQNVSGSNETRITTSGWDQVGPAIYSDRIVWQDMRNGNWDIYMYNLSSSLETRLSTNKSDQCNPAIFGDTIVWQDRRNGNWDIYMYNLTTSVETQITKNASDQFNPSIYGDMIVWQDNRRGNSDIYMYAISEANETQITVNETRQESPAIYDGKIVWNDGRNGNSDIYMCSTLKEEPELVMPVMPVANFSSNTTHGYTPLTVQFTDLSENATAQSWNFGDGTNSTIQNPVHIYSAAGNYTVTLTVSNENRTDTKSSYIVVSKEVTNPVAAFSASPTSGGAPLNVSFTDESTGLPTARRWYFSDGTNSTDKNPVHTFSKPGIYYVTLTVSNAVGSSWVAKYNYITVSNGVDLLAAFSASPTSGSAPLNVSFTDKSTGSPTAWRWSFSDGTNSTDKNPVHTFSKPGIYYVTLAVSNAGGSSWEVKYNYITVLNSVAVPVAAFSASPTSGSAPLNVSFTDESTGSPTSRQWNFGDGTSSTDKNPVHTFSKSGTYSIGLTVTNSGGSGNITKSRYITVK